MGEFQVDLTHLVEASAAWGDASEVLSTAAISAQAIQDSHKEIIWGIFADAWTAQAKAAEYMHDRLAEASTETHAIENVLAHVAKVYGAHDEELAAAIARLHGDS
ncbi:hypothetical protein [Nocardia noduli]|uniref:hypothetical protein n=1 Tax=Nocardia noduli TaxID=2815722 RepID=UPI001C217955|nr:hypothetical protein [Nocardia noduli]